MLGPGVAPRRVKTWRAVEVNESTIGIISPSRNEVRPFEMAALTLASVTVEVTEHGSVGEPNAAVPASNNTMDAAIRRMRRIVRPVRKSQSIVEPACPGRRG